MGEHIKHNDNCRYFEDNSFCTCGAVEQKALADIRKCLIAWRCVNCKHELLTRPDKPSGACPVCGVESVMHGVFSDDRDGLIEILNSFTHLFQDAEVKQ